MKNWETVYHWQTTLELKQAWRATPEPGFRPASVRVGWTDEAFVALADLSDAEIYNPATQFNEAAFLRGDVLEVFLRPEGQEPYFEFHVTPENCVLQLRLPSLYRVRASRSKDGPPFVLDDYKIAPLQIGTQTRVSPERERWQVLISIPYKFVVEGEPMRPGRRWLVAFARYDYTRGQPQPILSSTANHPVVDFHRPEDWTKLTWEK